MTIGAHSFLGNAITYPAGGKSGDNCLVGTKTLVPIDGPVRDNVGLLGSPPFEIPRSTQRDSRLDLSRAEFRTPPRREEPAQHRHHGLFLLARWLRLYVLLLIGVGAVNLRRRARRSGDRRGHRWPPPSFTLAYAVLIERMATGFRPLHPQFCSIYEPYFWWHERYWKLCTQPAILNGTPFKGLVWRLLGVRIGRRLSTTGAASPRRPSSASATTAPSAQAASSRPTRWKTGSSKPTTSPSATAHGRPGAFIHYGVTIGDDAVLGADAFLMKGERIAPATRWSGNPARPLPNAQLPRITVRRRSA